MAAVAGMAVAGMAKAAGVNLNHVSYKGLAPVTTDLAGGSLDLGLVDAGTTAAMINAGRLRGLAVTSANRLPGLPDVPTLRELGLPPPGIAIWVGTGLHRATPEPLAARLEQALQLVKKISPGMTYLTHMSHEMGLHAELLGELPEGVEPAFDGLRIEIR